jgi:hypothetical protein
MCLFIVQTEWGKKSFFYREKIVILISFVEESTRRYVLVLPAIKIPSSFFPKALCKF